ncbi:hypothetical protein AGMMS50276_28650 [Synergistales bacterium]|nr:hypothetical protein AGMMS50276_28650 [Synergistales bacterium]
MISSELFVGVSLGDIAANPGMALTQIREQIGERKLVIYGGALIGRVLLNCLLKIDIEPTFIVDRDARRINNVDGFALSTPDVLRSLQGSEYIIILAVSERTSAYVLTDLERLGEGFTLLQNGQKIADCLQVAICSLNHKRGEDVSHAYCGDCSILDSICPVLRLRAKDEIGYSEDKTKSKRTVTIGYLLGNVCTLDCKFCFESVPLYCKDEREFVNTATVIDDIERIAGVSECLTFVEFIGGEPFLHKGLPEIISACSAIPNIAYIHVFTNGTVPPSDELLVAMKSSKASVYVSNYTGFLTEAQSAQVKRTKKMLADNGILYMYGGEKKWFDMSNYESHNETQQELEHRYAECMTHNCNRLHDGILYVCPHHYAGTRLGKIPDANTVHIHEFGDAELAVELDKFKQIPYSEACRYCDMPYNAPIVMAGD